MISGEHLMLFLLCVYFVVCVTFLLEGNYPKALYWFGAFTITSSVVWMS